MIKIFFSLVICLPMGLLQAAVFGDGHAENGVEDSRISMVHSQFSGLQKSVGTVVCAGSTRGTAILLSVGKEKRPFLLTAAHVLSDSAGAYIEGCGYRARMNPWEVMPFVGEPIVGDYPSVSSVEGFAADWLVVGIAPWANWEHYAIPFSTAVDFQVETKKVQKETAVFVGFDTASSQILIDEDCVYGGQATSAIVRSETDLVWDNCDSESGSSGGALFAVTDAGPKLIAIRVGNLFDSQIYPEGPQQGDRFDLSANINVSRLVNQEIRLAVLALMSD